MFVAVCVGKETSKLPVFQNITLNNLHNLRLANIFVLVSSLALEEEEEVEDILHPWKLPVNEGKKILGLSDANLNHCYHKGKIVVKTVVIFSLNWKGDPFGLGFPLGFFFGMLLISKLSLQAISNIGI